MRGASPNRKVASGGGTEQGVATAPTPENQTEVGKAYVEKPTGRGDLPIALGESKPGFSNQSEEVLHGKGKKCEGIEKKHEIIAQSSESVSNSSTNHRDQSAFMHWEKTPFPKKEPNFKYVLAPKKVIGNNVDGPADKEAGMGPMALSYNPTEGWVAAELGLKSKHWKRLAREVNQTKPKGKKGSKSGKREGPNPLQDLDPNTIDQKRRKGLKQMESNLKNEVPEKETESMDGGVAVPAEQHHRAS
nr:hypothetical protein CFP56_37967 [Quercus suber]POE92524.1 hypothetical protein CFP56_37968 [Quercus suber]